MIINRQIESELTKYDIKSVLKEHSDYLVLLAERKTDLEKVFIKAPLNQNGRQAIEREYFNQKFFCELAEKQDCGFTFLPANLADGVIEFPDISGKVEWLGKMKSELITISKKSAVDAYLDEYLKLQEVMRQVVFSDLPEHIREDWYVRKENLPDKFRSNLDYLHEKGIISRSFVSGAIGLLDRYLDHWAFQHHDIVPWHMGRQPDGRLLLVDAGWAGWSLKYYDFAYTALQLIGYADRRSDAELIIQKLSSIYGNEKDFEPVLKAALYYRAAKLARELHEKGIDSYSEIIDFIR